MRLPPPHCSELHLYEPVKPKRGSQSKENSKTFPCVLRLQKADRNLAQCASHQCYQGSRDLLRPAGDTLRCGTRLGPKTSGLAAPDPPPCPASWPFLHNTHNQREGCPVSSAGVACLGQKGLLQQFPSLTALQRPRL